MLFEWGKLLFFFVSVPQGVLLLSSDGFNRDTSLVQGLMRVEIQ
jgi:hypothetical protein